MSKEKILVDALDHIAKIAGMARTQTKRLDWIQARAKTALQGDMWDASYKPIPRSDSPSRQKLKELNADLPNFLDLIANFEKVTETPRYKRMAASLLEKYKWRA